MPFTIDDVDKYNKGLGDRQKERWVSVANSVLNKCQGDDCESSAIKQANAVIKEMSESAEIKGVEIFATGVWHGDEYTEKDLDSMVESFSTKGFEAPVKLGHNKAQEKDGQPAFGWIERVYREGKKLLADFADVPKRVAEAIKNKQYRQVSSEIIWNYKEGMPRVLRAVALLGADIPEVKGLEPLDKAEIVFDDNEVDVKYCQIKFEDKWQEPEIYIFKEVEMETKEYQEKIEALEAKVAEFENKVQDGESAKAQLKEFKASARAEKIKGTIDKWKSEGKVLPAQESKLQSLMESTIEEKVYSEDGKEMTQLDIVCKLFDSMPNLVEFDELAKEDGEIPESKEFSTVSDEIDYHVKIYRDKDPKLSYSDAMDKVFADKPELKEKS
jgi:hypothetical protein